MGDVARGIEHIIMVGELVDEENVEDCERKRSFVGDHGVGVIRHVARGRLLDGVDDRDDGRNRQLRGTETLKLKVPSPDFW